MIKLPTESILIFCIFLLSVIDAEAQKGLYAKFSLGTGFVIENSTLKSSSFGIAMKNHAIGWGITDRIAVHIGEFGGLVKQKVEDYNFINLDSYGIGASYRFPKNINISFLSAYCMVSFAKKWSTPSGDIKGKGVGLNISIDKEWFISKRWGVRLGPQIFWLKTIDSSSYNFLNFSLNGSVVFYLKPHYL